MQYSFNLAWFIIGILIFAAGGAVIAYHRPLADNLGSGISSYDRFKLFGLITILVGFLVMTNLHTFILNTLIDLIFPSFK